MNELQTVNFDIELLTRCRWSSGWTRRPRRRSGADASKLFKAVIVQAENKLERLPLPSFDVSSILYDNNFTSIIDIYFYESFSTPNLK
jgi:hypothetical protein